MLDMTRVVPTSRATILSSSMIAVSPTHLTMPLPMHIVWNPDVHEFARSKSSFSVMYRHPLTQRSISPRGSVPTSMQLGAEWIEEKAAGLGRIHVPMRPMHASLSVPIAASLQRRASASLAPQANDLVFGRPGDSEYHSPIRQPASSRAQQAGTHRPQSYQTALLHCSMCEFDACERDMAILRAHTPFVSPPPVHPSLLPAWPERRLYDAERDAFSDCEATPRVLDAPAPRLETHHTCTISLRTPYHAHTLSTRPPRTPDTTRSRRCPPSTRAPPSLTPQTQQRSSAESPLSVPCARLHALARTTVGMGDTNVAQRLLRPFRIPYAAFLASAPDGRSGTAPLSLSTPAPLDARAWAHIHHGTYPSRQPQHI
ncbi:hypothetical protein DFH08DRAFT_978897 [Mycena albidolilacea]|uniref:Uncharacterized protein n=1 Tax=Mycena albidolilacea TaxID=1033008 RepID=A0AAD7E721_9AGAR|nr:hypothetical protein DFH08DRAFT_978897 [Mycena albidolilacea]